MAGFLSGRAWGATYEFDYQVDAYYSAVDFYIGVTTTPIPYYDETDEWEIYKKLFFSSPIPRFIVLEASVNPLPLAGVQMRKRTPDLYGDAQVSGDLNLIKSVTAGFEEPWALTLFMGNIISFRSERTMKYGEGRGHVGYLGSFGNFHIKDNVMIRDDWIEGEWKVKGDWIKNETELVWSFRLGAKFHANGDIQDVFYVGLRRSRTDFKTKGISWLKNSGFMYKFDMKQNGLRPVQHHLELTRKFPLTRWKLVPALSVGFLVQNKDKYSGDLRREARRDFQFLFRPNVEF